MVYISGPELRAVVFMAIWNSDTNDSAFAALLSGKKTIEVRANNPCDSMDYSKVAALEVSPPEKSPIR